MHSLLLMITIYNNFVFHKMIIFLSPSRHYTLVFMGARPSYDEYFMEMAHVVSKRSTCMRRKVGAILVKEKHILSTGYNGAPKGLKHCSEVGCLREELNVPSGERHELCRGLHAEQNVIIQASLHGVSLERSTIYATHTPCNLCAKMLVNAKIKRLVSFGKYDDSSFIDLFREAGIEVDTKKRPSSRIEYLD